MDKKHIKYLNSLTDTDIIDMIGDYLEMFQTGALNKHSKLKELTNIVCDDFNITYDITVGIRIFSEEVMKRFVKLKLS